MEAVAGARDPGEQTSDVEDLLGLSLAELSHLLSARFGEPQFRGVQLFRWLHQRLASGFEEMTDLSKDLRGKLAESGDLTPLVQELVQRSKDGTVKYRFRTRDGHRIESVFLPTAERKTLCVSTQAGCAMGCAFCMTATLGLGRNLRASEIVAQVHSVNRDLRAAGDPPAVRPLSNLVFMGMGEPLHNFENVKKALELLQSPEGPNFSHRHITVSTAGLVPQIERFGRETQAKLAISLNATTDEQRDRLMPINRRWNIAALLEACRKFPLRQGRRITFEYVLFQGLNDSDADARRLVGLLAGVPAKVNLISFNEGAGLSFAAATPDRVEAFREILAAGHVAAFVRENRGIDIAAACGQLANQPIPGVAAGGGAGAGGPKRADP